MDANDRNKQLNKDEELPFRLARQRHELHAELDALLCEKSRAEMEGKPFKKWRRLAEVEALVHWAVTYAASGCDKQAR